MNLEPETRNPEPGTHNAEPGTLNTDPVILNGQDSSLTTPHSSLTSERSSYRQIFKATSLFGGVQVFQILIGIIRVKFVAILLGTTGVGIMGLLNAPINLIVSITGLGIAFSAVRDVSEASGSGDQIKISRAITTLRRWSWFTGMFGSVVTLTFAPLLSKWSFGNSDYTWAFIWLSVTLLLQALSSGQRAILQGSRRLKDMAKSAVAGSVLGLITSIPLYYWLGLKGIVPALIVSAIISLILSWYYSRRVKIEKIEFSNKEIFRSGIGMAKLGIYMTIAGFVGTFSAYVLNAFISNRGGVDQVGLYNAGWGVLSQYTGMIFAAMATDYFPRLSAVQSDIEKIKDLVRQQGETALLIMTPMLALLIVAMPLVIRLLYTPAFLPVVMFASLTVLGMQFKAVSWSMGYVYLAKGNGRLFMIMEVIAGAIILLLNLLFYYLYGLNGLGISFILTYLIGMVVSYLVLRRKYGFSLPGEFLGRLLITSGFIILSFLTVFISVTGIKYIAGSIVIILASLYSFYKLNELMGLKSYLRSKLGR